jgi:L-lactate utilization protein LutB
MHFRDKVRKAVEDKAALDGMRHSFETILSRRDANAGRFPDLEERRKRLRELKESCVGNERLLADALTALRENGCRVILAKDSEAAIRAISAELEGQSLVVKSKSNITKALHLVESLSERGVEVVETDLGDRIVQLHGCEAVHPTGPACHLTRGQISELLSSHYSRLISDDPGELTTAVRDEISGFLERAQVGITGANAIAAREGAIVIVHNEGNAARCASLPGKHIVVTTPEKVVPSLRDAMDLVALQVYYSTGKVVSAYINVISGPSYTADIEKKIFKGMHGPKEVIVVLVDDGRLSAADREPLFCIGCGSCLTRCPVYSVVGPLFGTDGHMGGQGVHLLNSIDRLKDAHDAGLFLCTSCGECRQVCPVDIDTRKGILNGREVYNERKMEQTPERETVAASVRNYDNPWQMPRARKSRWAKGMDLPSKGEVLFFAGCSTSLLFPDSAKAAIGLIKAAGSEPAYLGVAEKCCGSTLRKLGATELARSKAESCFRDFAGAGAKTVVTSCPGCYSALDAHTDLKEEYAVEIQHISQFLSERMDRLDTGHVDGLGRVTYHDPCDLGREKGVFDEPRQLVEAALGAPICEMAWSGMGAACCGAGSGVKSGFPELALAMARQRIEQAVSIGADTVVTACPWCVQNLRECQGDEPDVNVIDLVELMSRSVDATSQRRS